MSKKPVVDIVVEALEDLKGKEITVLDVSKMTGVTDSMVICSGTSNRHVKSLADNVTDELRQQPVGPGRPTGDRGRR